MLGFDALGRLALGQGETRQQLASYLLTGSEYRAGLIDAYYATFLGHAPDAGALSFWTGALNGGAHDEAVLAQILASGEYFANRANSSNPALLAAPWPVLEAHVRDVVERGRAASAHVVNLGHGVSPETDPDVLTRVVELVHELDA